MHWIRVKNEAMTNHQEAFVQLDLVLKPLSTTITGNDTVRPIKLWNKTTTVGFKLCRF